MTKERMQNPVVGDTLSLKLHLYNSNNRADAFEVQKVDINVLDKNEISESNPYGLRLVETIEAENIVHLETGLYEVQVNLDGKYSIGKYCDVWSVQLTESQTVSSVEQSFEVFSDLWYSSPLPIVYDFKYNFRPNRIKKGSKRYLIIGVEPNVPSASELKKYYENLAIAAPLKIYIERICDPCNVEYDLNIVVEGASVPFREKGTGYYFLDTQDLEMECGMYNVWFEMQFGESLYYSDKQQLQIF